jgi:uncharacterized protein YjdB
VDENGVVTPVGTGTAVITATVSEDITSSCTVTVARRYTGGGGGGTTTTNPSVDDTVEAGGEANDVTTKNPFEDVAEAVTFLWWANQEE